MANDNGGLKSGAVLRAEEMAKAREAALPPPRYGIDGPGGLPRSPAAQMADFAEAWQLLADAKPRSLWQRLRGAWGGMVAGWRGEAGWQE